MDFNGNSIRISIKVLMDSYTLNSGFTAEFKNFVQVSN